MFSLPKQLINSTPIKKIARGCVFFLMIFTIKQSNAYSQSIDISMFGNGILVSSPNGNVLIDGTIYTCDEMIKKLTNALPPFDSLNLILTTHSHFDHILSDNLIANLKSNSKCQAVSLNDVKELIINDASYSGDIGEQIVDISPGKYNSVDTTINNIDMQILHIPHFTGFGDLSNNAFLININGFKVLHMGDALGDNYDDFKSVWTETDSIDVAFINNEFLTRVGISILKNFIKPKYLFVTHVGKPGLDVVQRVKDSIPDIIIAERGRYDMEIIRFIKEESILTDSIINFRPQFEKYSVTDTAYVNSDFEFTYDANWIINSDPLDTIIFTSSLMIGDPLPAWLSFDPASLRYYGVPDEAKKITVKLTATDKYYASNYGIIKIVILDTSSHTQTINFTENKVLPYPNPFESDINFLINLDETSSVEISIYTIEGKLIYSKQLNNCSQKETVNWDGQDMNGNRVKRGTYFYSIKSGSNEVMGKIIKL